MSLRIRKGLFLQASGSWVQLWRICSNWLAKTDRKSISNRDREPAGMGWRESPASSWGQEVESRHSPQGFIIEQDFQSQPLRSPHAQKASEHWAPTFLSTVRIYRHLWLKAEWKGSSAPNPCVCIFPHHPSQHLCEDQCCINNESAQRLVSVSGRQTKRKSGHLHVNHVILWVWWSFLPYWVNFHWLGQRIQTICSHILGCLKDIEVKYNEGIPLARIIPYTK